MSPEVSERYMSMRNTFVANNKSDTHQEVIDNFYVDGFEPDTLVYDPSQGTLPWYATKGILNWLDCVNLGFILRYKLINNSFEVNFKLKKIICM